MKTVLLYAQDDAGFESRLQAALDVARAQGGHVSCLQATPPSAYVAFDNFGGVFALPEVMRKLDELRAELQQKLEARLSREDVSWEVMDCTGDPAYLMVSRSSLADLVVLSRAPEGARHHDALKLMGDVLLGTAAPVLVVPETRARIEVDAPAAIAWNGSFEAGNAVRAALPLLRQASAVHIICVEEAKEQVLPSTSAARYLARHGIEAEVHACAPDGSIEETLVEHARRRRAGYLVMGAYGHSRAREYLFGGVTRFLLSHSPLPLLLAH